MLLQKRERFVKFIAAIELVSISFEYAEEILHIKARIYYRYSFSTNETFAYNNNNNHSIVRCTVCIKSFIFYSKNIQLHIENGKCFEL